MMGIRRSTQALFVTLAFTMALGLLGQSLSVAWAADPSPNKPSSTELVEQPKRWDGKTVTFMGEAIGEAMMRGDMAWLHLNDDGYYLKNVEEGSGLHGYNTGMPVWIPTDLARQVKVFGDYKHEGEVVKVRGTFNAACAIHGGDMDIHATELKQMIAGRHAIDHVRAWKVALAAGLALLALVLWWAQRSSSLTLERGAVTRKRA
jgi:hypothetical protein